MMGQRTSLLSKHSKKDLQNYLDKNKGNKLKFHENVVTISSNDLTNDCINDISHNGNDLFESKQLQPFMLINLNHEVLYHNDVNLLLGYEIYISEIGTGIVLSYVSESSTVIFYKTQLNCARNVIIPIKRTLSNYVATFGDIEIQNNCYVYLLQRLI